MKRKMEPWTETRKSRERSDLGGKPMSLAFNLLPLRTMRDTKEHGSPGEMAGPLKRQFESNHHAIRILFKLCFN